MRGPKLSMWLGLCFELINIVSASEYSIIDELRKEIEELKATTETTSMKAENEIHSLRAEIEELKATTETTSMKAENEIHSLRAEIEELKATTETTSLKAENEIHSLRAEIEENKCDNQNLKKDHANKRFVLANPFAEKPAFSAALSNHTMNLGNHQPIVFDKAFTNDLGAYSPVTGFFTVPINGTYFFTATVMSHYGQYLETEISLNGNSLVYMYSSDAKYEQGTNSVVLALKAGDSVCVRHQGNEGSNVYGHSWSSFSGFMI